jgi:hypothetical protein
MKRLHKIMISGSAYLEQTLELVMKNLAAAINQTRDYKPSLTPEDVRSLWWNKKEKGLRSRVQRLARRKRGQWAALVKFYFEDIFIPHKRHKKRSRTRQDVDVEEDVSDPGGSDESDEGLTRSERFKEGMKYLIDRSSLPNGTSALSLSTRRRPAVTHKSRFVLFALMIPNQSLIELTLGTS